MQNILRHIIAIAQNFLQPPEFGIKLCVVVFTSVVSINNALNQNIQSLLHNIWRIQTRRRMLTELVRYV